MAGKGTLPVADELLLVTGGEVQQWGALTAVGCPDSSGVPWQQWGALAAVGCPDSSGVP
jgi:hypothetical protein